eukprot:TRINITY_DN47606_c0_g1_i1.p1 TRINITY_DN47606_c0_g1~~TRINITY_DN47606_c0_g1_i1.p1  ORF type:complete len:612 (+),score=105.06 TRINITY_DN47606_c0_g1_i1:84-1919(+)
MSEDTEEAERAPERKLTLERSSTIGTITEISVKEHWPSCRKWLAVVVLNVKMDLIVGILIAINFAFMIHDTNVRAAGERPDVLTEMLTDVALPLLFCVELLLRSYVLQGRFFEGCWNVLDLVIVCLDMIFIEVSAVYDDMPSAIGFRILRILRAVRIVRAVRTTPIFRELYIMLHGFFASLKAIFWATSLLLMVMGIASMLAVELIHPLNKEIADSGFYEDQGCERCPRAFASVWAATLTFLQQIVAGDSWGMVTIPLMENYPGTIPFLMMVMLFVNLGLLNLILSVIVDNAQRAHADDLVFQTAHKLQEAHSLQRDLIAMCHELDTDNDKSITLNELLEGYENLPNMSKKLTVLGVQRAELNSLFHVLDEDRSGQLDYEELVSKLVKLKTQDPGMALMTISANVNRLKGSIDDMIAEFHMEIAKHMDSSHSLSSNILSKLEERQRTTADEESESKAQDMKKRVLPVNDSVTDCPQITEPAKDTSMLDSIRAWQQRVEADLAQVLQNLDQAGGASAISAGAGNHVIGTVAASPSSAVTGASVRTAPSSPVAPPVWPPGSSHQTGQHVHMHRQPLPMVLETRKPVGSMQGCCTVYSASQTEKIGRDPVSPAM